MATNNAVNTSLASQTGTGTFVGSTSPTLVTPILGAASATSLAFSSTTGLIGTTTNDSAAAGSVGEFVTASVLQGAPVSLTSSAALTITSISLTAGDWDVWGNLLFSPGAATSLTLIYGGLNTVTDTLPSTEFYSAFSGTAEVPPGLIGLSLFPRRFSLSGTTTVYMVGFANFTVDTLDAFGVLSARRMR